MSTHWLRHHAVHSMNEVAGPSVAAFYAGHRLSGVTFIYTHPTLTDVCTAFSKLYGPHPLARK